MNPKNVLLFPGAMQGVCNYPYNGVDIWMRKEKAVPSASVFVGHSLGATFLLAKATDKQALYILVNPLIEYKSLWKHFMGWVRFILFEGFTFTRAVPVRYWIHTAVQTILLLRGDMLKFLENIPKERIVVIRGKGDVYFCDKKAVAICAQQGIRVKEVEAGHNWNKVIDQTIEEVMVKFDQG